MPDANNLVRSRKMAREAALQALYSVAAAGQDLEHASAAAIEHQRLSPESAEFARRLMTGCISQRLMLEEYIAAFLKSGWGLDRIAVVDRVVLLLATFELYEVPGIPPKVTINEAIRMAQKYGAGDSSRFINGVLANILKSSPKSNWHPSMEEVMEPDEEVPEEEIQEVVVEEIEEGSEAHEELNKAGPWVIRTDD